jgi:hypothetical protein
VRKRRKESLGLGGRAAAMAGTLGALLWTRLASRPVDSVAILTAIVTSLIIIINALVLQHGAHPAPFFATPTPVAAGMPLGTIAPPPPPPLAHAAPTPRPLSSEVAARPNDPIAQLIGMSSRVMAVQRALSAYGYGQVRASGILDQPTSAAIERFERARGLPVTGKLSDRLVSELAAMVGHPLE